MVSAAPTGVRPSRGGLLPRDGLRRASGDGVEHVVELPVGEDLAARRPVVERPADEADLAVGELESGDVPVAEAAAAGVEVARRRERVGRPAIALPRLIE